MRDTLYHNSTKHVTDSDSDTDSDRKNKYFAFKTSSTVLPLPSWGFQLDQQKEIDASAGPQKVGWPSAPRIPRDPMHEEKNAE